MSAILAGGLRMERLANEPGSPKMAETSDVVADTEPIA